MVLPAADQASEEIGTRQAHMKYKKINVESIKNAKSSTKTNDLAITCSQDSGRGVTLNLSPLAQEQFLTALLARSPHRQPDGRLQIDKKYLTPVGLRRFEMNDGSVGLEFFLSHETAIHIVLATPLAEALKKLLDTFDDPKTWDTNKPH